MIKKIGFKKLLMAIIMLSLFLLSQNTVFAGKTLKLTYDGKTVNYSGSTYKILLNNVEVKCDLPSIVLNKSTMLPLRAVFEKMGGTAVWNNKTEVMDITYAGKTYQFKNNSASVKVNGTEVKMYAAAKLVNGRLLIPASYLNTIKDVSVKISSSTKTVAISTKSTLRNQTSNNVTNNSSSNAGKITLVYDGKTVKYTGTTYKITINNVEVKSDMPVFDLNKVTMFPLRAVFEKLGGTVVWNSKTQVMTITYAGKTYLFKNNSSIVTVSGSNVKMSAPAKLVNGRLVVPTSFLSAISDIIVTNESKLKTISISTNFVGSIMDIISTNIGEKTVVTLKMTNSKGYKVYRQTNPNRIVVDFKNIKAEASTNAVNLNRVTDISVAPLSATETSIIIGLKEMDNFSVEQTQDGCKLTIQKPINTTLSYDNSHDRVYFSFKGIQLANSNSRTQKYFTEQYDKNTFKYTITIPSSSAISMADEVFNINDALVSTVEIFRDQASLDTKLVVNGKKDLTYYTSYNEKRGQSEINLLTPAKEGEQLVVIDAGHGGLDPGAVYNGVQEKDINLKMALKLEKLLKEQNIKTYMLRQDDTFVGLYDRPRIANALKATLFISIHNNYVDSKSTSGTETLYYPGTKKGNSISGEELSKIVQELLIKTLGSVNRKTVSRDGLVVLNSSNMPAALVEIGFISNAAEAKKLVSDNYQQLTAKALSSAIVKVLDILKPQSTTNQTQQDTSKDQPQTDQPQTDQTPIGETQAEQPQK